jgi:hypothetical protein
MRIDWHFVWGLLIVTAEKGIATEYHIFMLVHWLFFSGVSYCGNRVLFFTMIQRRKNIKTLGNLIDTQGLRPLV